jgi:hypothetical protein
MARFPTAIACLAAFAAAQEPATLRTRWAADVAPERAHAEYPRPQLVRAAWQNLNGLWEYAIAPRATALPERYEGAILVPFPVESALSGVARRVGAEQRLWYRRTFTLPEVRDGQRWLLHFGAVDWHAEVWVDGARLGEHRGGYAPFTFALDGALDARTAHELVVAVRDPTDRGTQPRGKQVEKPHGIWYTPVTGIWQTVWLEPVPRTHVRALVPSADLANDTLTLRVSIDGPSESVGVHARALVNRAPVATASAAPGEPLALRVPHARRWSPDDPFLYDLEVELRDAAGAPVDRVTSVFGMREIALRADQDGVRRLFLNGAPLFQFGPLDQGWWPDGLYTAPTDAGLAYDLDVIKRLGFNMVRKHVKVEPARWYHHCDRIGLLVWQDMPSGDRSAPWDANGGHDGEEIERTSESAAQYDRELRAIVDALAPFACIIAWVPFNEAWGQFDTERVTRWLQEHDPTRLVNCASGGNDFPVGHVKDIHAYPGPAAPPRERERAIVLGEFGGLGLPLEGHTWTDKANWGYRTLQTRADLQSAYLALIAELRALIDEGLAAAVYTQITDVETEVNGLLTYDRAILKVDADALATAHRALYLPPPRIEPLVPTAEHEPQTWRYSMAAPSEGWQRPDFDDGGWATGPAGFGAPGTPGAVVRTEWRTPAIWIRRAFEWSGDAPSHLHLRLHHDEDVEVWLNGERVAARAGYVTRYMLVPLAGAALRAGRNVLALHCRQTAGGQYVDAGLVDVRGR